MKKNFDKKEVKGDYKFPSRFGSHATMVDKDRTATLNDSTLVVCKDEFGFYTTYTKRLDSGMADPNRYAESRNLKHDVEREK